MSKYRLKKDLPEIGKKGLVVEWSLQSQLEYANMFGMLNKFPSILDEYFELIPEVSKEWKIVTFELDGIVSTLREDGKYHNNEGCSSYNYALKNQHIHSVKRLIDNEVFTVGDEVIHFVGDYTEKIKSFVVPNIPDRIWFNTERLPESVKDLSNFSPLPKPNNKEDFHWTDELACEWAAYSHSKFEMGNSVADIPTILPQWKEKKQSKSPSIPVDTPNPDIMEYYKKHEKKFTQQNLDKAIEQTWEAARQTHPLAGMKYPTLQSYLQSLK